MCFRTATPCVAVLLFLLYPLVFSQICYETRYQTQVQSKSKIFEHSHGYDCGWFGWRRCTRHTYTQVTTYLTVTVSYNHAVCCPGFSGISPHCTPICNPTCANHGQCYHRSSSGTNYCECQPGFRGNYCQNDTNECIENSYNCQPPSVCHNTVGSYRCACPDGYMLAYDGRSCIDKDECADGSHTCGSNGNCENVKGSFICHCGQGYETPAWDPKRCIDIDECGKRLDDCQQNCTNYPGYYLCSCNEGYTNNIINLRKCDDIDECKEGTDNCAHRCENTLGSYKCDCNLGCELASDGVSCEDFNECNDTLLNTSNCDHECTNLHCENGRYFCSCHPGYSLHYNNHTCEDINECSSSNGGCEQTCNNIIGSYLCSCDRQAGYRLSSNGLSCEALPCPTLIAPVNGYMQCSDYPVVVNSTCSFTCKDEYDLFGSSVRICDTDTTWNGTGTDCQIKQCPQIQTPPNSVQLQSCQTSVNSSCFFSCVPGYFIDSAGDATYNQECTITEGVALWTAPEECKETSACDPSPCLTGTCYVSDSNEPYCVCPDGYVGDDCGTLSVTISDLPLLNNNERSPPISIYASPQSSVTVSITTEPPVAIIPSDQITIYHPDNVSNFYLETTESNVIRLKLRVSNEGEEEATTIDDKVTIASDEKATGRYFKGGDRTGIALLTEGCCKHDTVLITRFCTKRPKQSILFTSTCAWTGQNNEYTSNGIIFVSVGRLSLPVSIIGINMQLSDEGLTTDFTHPGLSCPPCTRVPQCTSAPPQRIEDVRDMVKRLSMMKTFLSAIGPILPQHLTIKADGVSNKNYYSTGDYLAKIVPEYELSSLLECPNIPIDTTNTDLYYVITTSSGLQFAYNNDKQSYASSGTVCFAYPLCSGERTLLISVPPKLNNQIQNLTIFSELKQQDWKIDIKSIETSHDALSKPVTYWDGIIFTDIQTNHKLKAELTIHGDFQEQYLQVQFSFHGTISEANDNTETRDFTEVCQAVPHTVEGEMSVKIKTGLIKTQEHSVLHLAASNSQGLYVKKGAGCDSDGANPNPGLEFDLYLSPLQSNGMYSKYIHQLQLTEPCLVKSHFWFNNFDNINSVSLLSRCFTFRIKELEFPSLPIKLILYPNIVPIIPNRVTTVILESRLDREITIGNFITMLPNSNSRYPDLQAILFSDDDDIICVLPSVNISLFDTKITTRVQIDENRIQFASPLQLFYLGNTEVSGRGSTDRSWGSLQLTLQVVFTNDFISELTTYLNAELKGEVEDTVQHIESANDTLKATSKQVSNLKLDLQKLYNELYDIQTSLDNYKKRKIVLEKQRDQHETILYHILETYWNATDQLSGSIESVCQITECERACKSGPVLTLCFVPVTMKVPKFCSYYAHEVVTIYEKKKIPVRICTYSRNQLKEAINFLTPIGLTSNRKLKCKRVTVYETDWEPLAHTGTVLKTRPCSVKAVKNYINETCNYTSPCAVYEVDPVCDARNEECYDNRTKIIENFNEENEELLEDIRMRRHFYKLALSQLVDISSKVAILKLKNISKMEEIEATYLKIQISQESEKVANKSYQSIKIKNKKILLFRDELKDNFNSIIRITDVSFDVTLETQTPVIVPLNVIYEIISRRTTHEVRIVVDVSATDDLVKKTIYDNIYDDIIDNVIGGSLRKRRNVASSVLLTDIFKDNCDLQRSIINYLEQLNLSLSAVQEDIFDSISTINTTRENENSNYEATAEALRSIGTDLSLSLLVKEGMIYASQMEAFNLVSFKIAETKMLQWKADLDEFHNETSNLFGQTCYSLFDCLSTSVTNIRKLIAPLAIFNNSEMAYRLNDVQLTVQELSINTNWTLDDMQYTISKVHSLAIEVDEDSYWCASSPLLLDQPPVDVEDLVGRSLFFSCPSSSLLPVTYSWYKNRKPIPFATTSSFSIPYLTRADAGLYECEVKNAIGVTKSKPTVLRVYKKPTFTQEPDSITVINNDRNDAYFICQANAYPLPNYQWSYRKDNYSKWKDLYGETEGLLSISNVSDSNEGQYRCKAGNEYGTIYSKPVTLTVLPGTFTRMSYNFTITINNVDNSSLIQSIENSFITAVDNLIDINLTPVQIISTNITNNYLKILFVMLSSNYSFLSEVISNEAWFNHTIADLRQLQENKIALESAFHDTSHPFLLKMSLSILYSIGSSISSPLIFKCYSGYQFDTSKFVCVGCDTGSYQNNNYIQKSIHQSPGVLLKYTYPVCELCPKGTFQSDKAARECHSCPPHHSTVGRGSTSVEDCQALCAPGTYSDTGYEPCQKCAVSHYQTLYGSKFCLPCTKESNVSTCIKDQCKEDQYSSTGFEPCQSCDKGTYQESRGQVSCINCTESSTNIRCLQDCHLPPYAGLCNGKFQRYFYNKTSKQCERFTYGGCNPNKNNFHYQYDCENECGECPPTCTAQFCLLHRFNVCSMSPFPEPNNNCPGGCRLSSCQAYYYSPTIVPHPKGGDSCTKCDGQELDVNCMRNWGTCLRIAYIQSPDYEYHPITPANFHCWEYKC